MTFVGNMERLRRNTTSSQARSIQNKLQEISALSSSQLVKQQKLFIYLLGLESKCIFNINPSWFDGTGLLSVRGKGGHYLAQPLQYAAVHHVALLIHENLTSYARLKPRRFDDVESYYEINLDEFNHFSEVKLMKAKLFTLISFFQLYFSEMDFASDAPNNTDVEEKLLNQFLTEYKEAA